MRVSIPDLIRETRERFSQLFPTFSWKGFFFSVVYSFLLALVLRLPSVGFSHPAYSVGDIASQDIYSPRDLSLLDETATLDRRKAAADGVKSVYDFHANEFQRISDRLEKSFNLGQKLINARDRAVFGQKSLKNLIEEQLGVQLSEPEFQMLLSFRFSDNLRKALERSISSVSQNVMVVSSKELLTPDISRGVTRRMVQGSEILLEEYTKDFSHIVDLEGVRERLKARQHEFFAAYSPRVGQLLTGTAQRMLRPNLTLNQTETEGRRKSAFDQEENEVPIVLKKGAIIIRSGATVEPRHLSIFKAIARERKESHEFLEVFSMFFLLLFLIEILRIFSSSVLKLNLSLKDFGFIAFSSLSILLLCRGYLGFASRIRGTEWFLNDEAFYYVLPISSAVMVVRMVMGAQASLLVGVLMGFASSLLLDRSIVLGLYFFIVGIYGAREVERVKKRPDFFVVGVKTGLLSAVLVVLLTWIKQSSHPILQVSLSDFGRLIALGFSGPIIASVIFLTLFLLVAESVFNYTTDFKLMELSNQNSPLLKELMVQAPGTYHHSIIVGTLSEAAATAIGENGLLARVSCLYHDIGKMKKPLYYVENQTYTENRHDKLTPRMSARVIQAHVKDGIEMANEARLPKEIIDIIPQHHGTRMISFFYNKAKEQADPQMETIDEKDFRYEGPKPQSRIAGIILLADGLEARTRVLEEPTPARIKAVVREHINKIFSEGELDETNLTLRDLSDIAEAFTRVLTSVFHHRIDYPTGVKDAPSRLRKIHDKTLEMPNEKAIAQKSHEHSHSKEGDESLSESKKHEKDRENPSSRFKIS